MLKLNLLPPSIAQKRQMRVAIAMVTVLVAAEIGGLVAMRIPKQKKHAELLVTQTDVTNQLNGLNKVKSDADAVLAEEAKIAPKYDFITGMLTYNQALPDLYQKTAAYTYKEIMFLDMEAAGNELKMDAYASKPADVGRLLIGLNNSGLFTALPTVSALPAYSQAEEEARKQAELQENNPGSEVIRGYMPSDMPGAAGGGYSGGGGYPGGGGMSGGPGGYPGGAGGGGGYSGGGYPGGGMKFGGGGYPGGAPAASSMSGYPGGGGMGGYPGSGGQGGGGDMGALNLAGARKQPRGFKITVTGILKTTAKRPSYGTSDQQAGESGKGGGGGYPGGGGGYPGGGGYSGGGYPGGGMRGYSGGGYPGGK